MLSPASNFTWIGLLRGKKFTGAGNVFSWSWKCLQLELSHWERMLRLRLTSSCQFCSVKPPTLDAARLSNVRIVQWSLFLPLIEEILYLIVCKAVWEEPLPFHMATLYSCLFHMLGIMSMAGNSLLFILSWKQGSILEMKIFFLLLGVTVPWTTTHNSPSFPEMKSSSYKKKSEVGKLSLTDHGEHTYRFKNNFEKLIQCTFQEN